MAAKYTLWALLGQGGLLFSSGCASTSESKNPTQTSSSESTDPIQSSSQCYGYTLHLPAGTREKAETGDVGALFTVGNWYFSPCGGNDKDMAVVWYQRAVEKGHILSARKLGDIYNWRGETSEDLENAEKWYRLAAA